MVRVTSPDATHRPVVSAVELGLGLGGDAVGVGAGEAVGGGALDGDGDGTAEVEGDAVDSALEQLATSRTAIPRPASRLMVLF
ncbi:MAG TPA: hypothetical protein VIB02_08560 [Candidatus Limnocylindrales bacterium]|jgi:hypothetical protein